MSIKLLMQYSIEYFCNKLDLKFDQQFILYFISNVLFLTFVHVTEAMFFLSLSLGLEKKN